jgi:hypothetical protein
VWPHECRFFFLRGPHLGPKYRVRAPALKPKGQYRVRAPALKPGPKYGAKYGALLTRKNGTHGMQTTQQRNIACRFKGGSPYSFHFFSLISRLVLLVVDNRREKKRHACRTHTWGNTLGHTVTTTRTVGLRAGALTHCNNHCNNH